MAGGYKKIIWGKMTMKAQMKFQKILSLLTLIIGALTFVFALCYFSGNLSDLMYYHSKNLSSRYSEYLVDTDTFLDNGQFFVSALVIMSIVYICIAAVLYITDTNKRRNYYVTNYVAIGLTIAITATVAIFCLAFSVVLLILFENINIGTGTDTDYISLLYNKLKDQGAPAVGTSKLMFVLGLVVGMIVLANCIAWILNLVWKIKLMKGEKALLQGGLVKEVA